MYSEIFESIRTKHELDLLMAELELLKQSIFETKAATFEEILKRSLRDEMADMIKTDLRKDDKITKQEYIDGLIKALEKIKIVTLTVSFEPTGDVVEKIFEWINKNLGSGVIINFIYRPKTIGGAIIEFKGKYHDYSLSKTLDELFQIKTEELMAELKKAS